MEKSKSIKRSGVQWHSAQVLSAIAGVTLIFSVALADQGLPLRAIPFIVGVLILAAIPSRENHPEELYDFTLYLLSGWQLYSQGILRETREIVANSGSIPLANWVDGTLTDLATLADPAFFSRIANRSFMVCGVSEAGKTWIMHQAVLWSYANNEDVLILDAGIGKRGLEFTWHDLPMGTIVHKFNERTPENLPNLVYTVYEERNRRREIVETCIENKQAPPNFKPLRLYITEWNETQAAYDSAHRLALINAGKDNEASVSLPPLEQIQIWLDALLFDGLGYQIRVALEVHSAAVGRSNIDESQRSQLNWLVLGTTAVQQSELRKFGLTKEWVGKLVAIRARPGKGRAAIAIINGLPVAFVPERYGDTLTVAATVAAVDPVKDWLDTHSASILEYLESNPNESASSSYDHRFKLDFPKGYANRQGNNPYWIAYRDFCRSFTKVESGQQVEL